MEWSISNWIDPFSKQKYIFSTLNSNLIALSQACAIYPKLYWIITNYIDLWWIGLVLPFRNVLFHFDKMDFDPFQKWMIHFEMEWSISKWIDPFSKWIDTFPKWINPFQNGSIHLINGSIHFENRSIHFVNGSIHFENGWSIYRLDRYISEMDRSIW